jgi:hypothetical protein
MSQHATGSFQVVLAAQALVDETAAPLLGRMTINKTFTGDLEACSKGEMLMASTSVKGSAGYVAIERVTGTLEGRHGSFVLQHAGSMHRGAPQLSVTVVPDSGTDELLGLSGTLSIIIEEGEHRYEFAYAFSDQP